MQHLECFRDHRRRKLTCIDETARRQRSKKGQPSFDRDVIALDHQITANYPPMRPRETVYDVNEAAYGTNHTVGESRSVCEVVTRGEITSDQLEGRNTLSSAIDKGSASNATASERAPDSTILQDDSRRLIVLFGSVSR